MIQSRTCLAFGVLSLAVALVSYRFVIVGLEEAFPGMVFHIEARRLAFLLHVVFGPLALIIGAIQFSVWVRSKYTALHRWFGRIYLVSIVISGFAGLALAVGSYDRPIAATGFLVLSILWIGFTLRAVQLAMARRVEDHRRWMIRSFALTFAAVTLRLQLPVFMGLMEMSYLEASTYVAWTSWLPNLLIAERLCNKKNYPFTGLTVRTQTG